MNWQLNVLFPYLFIQSVSMTCALEGNSDKNLHYWYNTRALAGQYIHIWGHVYHSSSEINSPNRCTSLTMSLLLTMSKDTFFYLKRFDIHFAKLHKRIINYWTLEPLCFLQLKVRWTNCIRLSSTTWLLRDFWTLI